MTERADGVAIVGAALRLPGARSLRSLWTLLLDGGDAIERAADVLPDYEQQPLGVPDNARFVPAYGRIDGVTAFDHERFDMPAAEAMLTDPQQRVLLEVVDEALHTAAIGAAGRAATALFVGTGLNAYEQELRRHLAGSAGVDDTAVELGTARDYAAGRLAYRLGLGGPAVNVLAACSTALVAVHLACRALLEDEADVAVAGVSAIRYPERRGYWAIPGGISSPDGVCRPFDARAAGTVPADGVGAVVLKRLADARAAGDDVLGVVIGSAVNNDGRKDGFAAVSGVAQEAMITAAQRVAGVEPRDVGYVESHGTATRLGDAVEWSVLQQLFAGNEREVLVGAVKGNLGHTREAAGMAGLLKALAVLQHGVVPPSGNFASLAGDLAASDSPVRPVGAAAVPEGDLACVSAFGLGGTNAHVVLRRAPPRREVGDGETGIVLLSNPRPSGLDAETDAVRAVVAASPGLAAGVAARSQARAHPHAYRRYVALHGPATPTEGAIERATRRVAGRPLPPAFLFPGVGSEYSGMGARLARAGGAFATSLAETVRLAAEQGVDLGVLDARDGGPASGRTDFRRMLGRAPAPPALPTPVAHLALFAVQLALVDLLDVLGVRPAAVAGHSLGEWTAATVAGALDRREAVAALARRAELIDAAPRGVTLAVGAPASAVRPLLAPGTTIAADNGAQSCSASGPEAAIAQLEPWLTEAGIVFRRLATRAAFHHPDLSRAAEALPPVTVRPPALPIASGMTGGWLAGPELDDRYWREQLVRPVRFRETLQALADRHPLVLEIGPGTALSWVLQTAPGADAIRTMRSAYEDLDDVEVLRSALAELWLHGHDPAWPGGGPWRMPADPLVPALERIELAPRAHADAAPVHLGHRRDDAPRTRAVPLERDELGQRLARLWCAVLGVDAVAGHDNFFALGGDSLLGRHLMAMVRDATGVDVPGEVVFASAELDGMAAAVHAWTSEQAEARA